jgi:hypothetical protein
VAMRVKAIRTMTQMQLATGGDDGEGGGIEYVEDGGMEEEEEEEEEWLRQVQVAMDHAEGAAEGWAGIPGFGDEADDPNDPEGFEREDVPVEPPPVPPLAHHDADGAPSPSGDTTPGADRDGGGDGGDTPPRSQSPARLVDPPVAGEAERAAAEAEGAAPDVPDPPHVPRGARRANFPQALHPSMAGYIRLSQTNGNDFYDMRAVCFWHKCCTVSRQCKANLSLGRPGRPLGLLWSFLENASKYATKEAHTAAKHSWGAFDNRKRARDDFHTHAKATEYESTEVGYEGGHRDEPEVSE